jgi:hypothetical protein
MKALYSDGIPDENFPNPLIRRYFMDLKRNGFGGIIFLHYSLTIVLGLMFWNVASGGSASHPEIFIKMLGAYCFLISIIALPLVITQIFPNPGESDPTFDTSLVPPISIFDARTLMVAILGAILALPVLPLFLMFSPLLGRSADPFDIFPYLLAIMGSVWVHIFMEIASGKSQADALPRRLGVIAFFILLHLGLVGLLAQLAFPILQQGNLVKLLIDVNPFSQLYILMEGSQQQRLILNTDFQRLIDYRLYLFVLQALALGIVLGIYRKVLKSKPLKKE